MRAQPESPTGRRVRLGPRLIIALVVAVLVILFIVQNRDTVDITVFFSVVSAPLWTTLTAVAALGLLCGYLLARRS